jgi:putative ABC transport system permease protein
MDTPVRFAIAQTLIRLSGWLVPGGVRQDWRHEWDAELASLSDLPARYQRPIRRALGAFADAFWLRQRSIADFDWIDDVRHGLRQLVQHSGFATTVIAIASLGLAATVTMFSVTDQILLRPLPYPQPERIVTFFETRGPEREPDDVAPGNFLDWRERSRSFDFFAGVEPWSLDIFNGPRPEVWSATKVTQGFFETFGVTPLAGRLFSPDDYAKGRDRVIVISETFWRDRLGSNPSTVGSTVRSDDGPLTIIGIVPASFEPRLLSSTARPRNIWVPKAIEPYESRIRGSGYWAAVGRLKGDVTIETAQAEMTAIAAQLAVEQPRTNEHSGVRIRPLRDHLVGNVELAVALLAGAVGLVLLIACVNIANLLLARGSAREREMAVRVALGAGRGRLIQQLLLESLVIALAGGIAGAALAMWALEAIARLGPATVPWIETLRLDWRALAFGGVMSAIVALLSGALPAWRVARTGLSSAGRSTTTADPSQHRLRAGLVVAEIAVALVLLSGAGLLLRSFVGLMNVDPGFQRDRVLVAQVFAYGIYPTPADLGRFFDTTIARLSALPAVQHAGAVSAMPFIESNINIQDAITISGRPPATDGESPRAYLSIASPGYFDAMRIPLIDGRSLDARDGAEAKRVAVISDALARRYWTDADNPIGDTLTFRFSGRSVQVEVVGVVGALRHDRLDGPSRGEVFMPLAQMPFGSMTFVVRSAGDATALLEPVRAAIWEVSPTQTIYRTATLDELVRNTVSQRQFALAMILGFAGLALLLAVAGVYGVLSALMTTRLREVGLRVALGASRADILRLILGRGCVIAGLGLVIGLGGALGAAQLLKSFLFQITPADPVTIGASAIVMSFAALAACYLPARRAAAADPLTVLRSE